jgi:Uma2 family endonuclease
MLAVEEEVVINEQSENEMPSFNHSYICNRIMRQLFQSEEFEPFPELTLNIGNGITPDISVYPKDKFHPDFFQDVAKFPEMPLVAIEVISASQNIQDLLDKSNLLVEHGVKAVWAIEPFGRTIFVTTKEGKQVLHDQEVESEGIKVDFRQIFG